MALTVLKATRQASMPVVATDGTILGQESADKDKMYLVAEVIIETTNRDKAPYSPTYFQVKDSKGAEYMGWISATGDSLKNGDLAKGEKIRGTVAFQIGKEAKGLVLSYEPAIIAGGYEPIIVALD